MKFFAVSLLALGASAAPATFTQHHHTLSTPVQGITHHKQLFSAPLTQTYNKVDIAKPVTFQQVAVPKVVAEPVAYNYVNKVQTVGYVQPTTYVHPTTYVQPTYVQPTTYLNKATTYVQPTYVQPATTYVHKAAQYVPTTYQTSEVQLPVHQVDRTVQYLDVPHVEKPAQIQTIRIAPSTNPLHIHFDSQGSQLTTSQSHTKVAPAEPKYEESHDDPSHLNLQISKKVHQTVTETVYPERKIEQVIAPLTESVNTVVSRATHERAQYVAPQVHHQTLVKTVEAPKIVNTVEVPQTYVQAVNVPQTIVKTVEAPQTYVQAVDAYVKPVVENVQTYVKPEYVQGQSFEYVSKPIATTIIKPTAHIANFAKEAVVEKAVEY